MYNFHYDYRDPIVLIKIARKLPIRGFNNRHGIVHRFPEWEFEHDVCRDVLIPVDLRLGGLEAWRLGTSQLLLESDSSIKVGCVLSKHVSPGRKKQKATQTRKRKGVGADMETKCGQ